MAKKKLGFLTEALLSVVLPKAIELGSVKLVEVLNDFYEDNPELAKTLTVSLYPFIDVYVEGYADKTKAKWDDNAVDELKEAVEEFATSKGIELPNLDAD